MDSPKARRLRVAVVQAAAAAFDRDACLDRVETLARKAAGDGASLVLFPEVFVPGFPAALDWPGPATAFRDPAGGRDFRRDWENAVEPGDAADRRLAALSAELGVHHHVGVVERHGGSLANSVFAYAPVAGRIAIRRKLMPTHGERTVWMPADGATLRVQETALARLGVAICWENYMPLLRAALYAERPEVWLAPTADDSDAWIASMRHIALEGRCYVLAACQHAIRADYPADYDALPEMAPDTVLFAGGSVIVGPDGGILAGPLRGGAGILLADLDLGGIVEARHTLDVAGHYARPDIFDLRVDRRARPPGGVRLTDDAATGREWREVGANGPQDTDLAHTGRQQ